MMLPNKGECALMGESIRTPQQKRSIDKKNRIIEAGYELFARDGYFNTNTAQIAKHAGAGTSVPISGFANSIVSSALEFQTEGRILGTAAQMFSIAGPVIVFGCSSAAVYGFIYWLIK